MARGGVEVTTTPPGGYKPTAGVKGGEQSPDNIPRHESAYAVEWPARAESVGKMMIEVNGPLFGEGGFGRRCLGGHLSSHAAFLFGEPGLAAWLARTFARCAGI